MNAFRNGREDNEMEKKASVRKIHVMIAIAALFAAALLAVTAYAPSALPVTVLGEDDPAGDGNGDVPAAGGITLTIVNGTVTVNGTTGTSVVLDYGQTVTITADPAPEGKRFKSWKLTGIPMPVPLEKKETLEFTMLTEAQFGELSANLSEMPEEITLTAAYETIPEKSLMGDTAVLSIASAAIVLGCIGIYALLIRRP